VPSRVVEWRGAWPVQTNGKRDRRAIAAALGLPRGPPLEHP
jgi:hypothetical protein